MNRKHQSAGSPEINQEASPGPDEVNFPVYANPNIRQPQDNYYACPRQLAVRIWTHRQHNAGRKWHQRNQQKQVQLYRQEKNAILLISERSSIVHENICFGACYLTITFYEEKEIYRENKNKSLQATDFSLTLSNICTYKKNGKKKQP